MVVGDEGTNGQAEALQRTPLFETHVRLGARMVPFAGWEMPVQYPTGILNEHRTVRSSAGLFDLGHMGQVMVGGPDAQEFLQRVTTNDVAALEPGQAQYSMLPLPNGGIIDDILVYRAPDGDLSGFGPTGTAPYFLAVNASNAKRDVAWLNQQLADSGLNAVINDVSPNTGMLAIQGPHAVEITSRLTDVPISDLGNYYWGPATVAGIPLMIGRTGYTGEDGFELFPDVDRVVELWDALMQAGADLGLAPIGLGARDTLRLEARMPLYGQELGEELSPYEAGLGFAIKLEKGDFVGRDKMAAVKQSGPARKVVGFKMTERSGVPRTHYPVQCEGREIGHVTSGAFSPTLGANIGLAMVEASEAKVGKPIEIIIRGKPVAAEQVATPFYKRAK